MADQGKALRAWDINKLTAFMSFLCTYFLHETRRSEQMCSFPSFMGTYLVTVLMSEEESVYFVILVFVSTDSTIVMGMVTANLINE